MYLESLGSTPGSVGQVRSCAHELIRIAKKNCIIILVGHVTKDGTIAGPKSPRAHGRHGFICGREIKTISSGSCSCKNRFGPTDEIGVFEMREEGLMEVKPISCFLGKSTARCQREVLFCRH